MVPRSAGSEHGCSNAVLTSVLKYFNAKVLEFKIDYRHRIKISKILGSLEISLAYCRYKTRTQEFFWKEFSEVEACQFLSFRVTPAAAY